MLLKIPVDNFEKRSFCNTNCFEVLFREFLQVLEEMNRLTFSGAILRRVLFAENRQNLAIFLPSAFVQCPQCNLQRKQSLAYGGYSNPDKLQTPFFVSLRSPFRKQKVQTRVSSFSRFLLHFESLKNVSLIF